MKLQNLTVIFIVIIMPVILLVSLYISTGLKTINYQSLYDTGLLTATHDAIYAFEINTANNDYSDNAETKRNILKSSVKMFETSLANTCGISSYSREEIEEYIPAIVFGMYDGFYMYAPSAVYNHDKSKYEYTHNLKNYVYYSEIINDNTTIIYSLDNYVIVSHKLDNGDYIIEEGYLIVDEYWKDYIYEEDNVARVYYEQSIAFTNWFENIVSSRSDCPDYLKISENNNPEDENSLFVQNKRKIIREKIESVLNSSITAYSKKTWGYNYKMPKLSEEDWDKIYNNISMISFFQGKNIGLTKYNGYCVLNSTNHTEYANPNLMYFIDGEGYYHDIRCSKFKENLEENYYAKGYRIGSYQKKKVEDKDNSTEDEVKYKYVYENFSDMAAVPIPLACYNCVNGSESINTSIREYIENNGETIRKSYITSLARERYKTAKLLQSAVLTGLTECSIEVIWDDDNNRDGIRPEEIDVTLLEKKENEEDFEYDRKKKISKANITGDSNMWKIHVEDLYSTSSYNIDTGIISKIDGYEEVTITADEANKKFTITCKHTPEKIDKKIEVKWNDTENMYNTRPSEFKVKLLKNGDILEEYITSSDIFKSLYKNENGTEIDYTVEIEGIDNDLYTTEIKDDGESKDGNSFSITNNLKTVDKLIEVSWKDNDNSNGLRPNEVNVRIKVGDNVKLDNISLNSANGWNDTVTLPRYDANGNEISYSVEQITTHSGYNVTYSSDTFTITNTLKTVDKNIKVEWKNDSSSTRPSKITLKLKNGNTVVRNIELDTSNNITEETIVGLVEYNASGGKVDYTIEQEGVDTNKYLVNITDDGTGDTFTIINTLNTTSKNIKIAFNDYNNKDGIRPSSVNVTLKKNVNGVISNVQIVAVSSSNGFVSTINNLPQYENGYKITYSIDGATVTGYTKSVSGNVITYSYTPDKMDKWEQSGTTIKGYVGSTHIKTLYVGNIINYDCTSNGNKSYTSQSTKNGHSKQTFTTTTGISWRVYGVEDGKLLIASTNIIDQKYILKGMTGYNNAKTEWNEICKIYGHGKGAKGARSVNNSDDYTNFRFDKNFKAYFMDSYTHDYPAAKGYVIKCIWPINNGVTTVGHSNGYNLYTDWLDGTGHSNTVEAHILPIVTLSNDYRYVKQSNGSYNIE